MMKRNEGFTLVELMVSIAIATLVITAATSTLLLGLRINAQTTKNIEQQNTTDLLMQVLQNVAEEENVAVDEDNQILLLFYDADGNVVDSRVFLKHEGTSILLNDSEFMKEVTDFEAVLSEDRSLLTITIEANEKEYTSSAYCRLNPTPDQGGNSQ